MGLLEDAKLVSPFVQLGSFGLLAYIAIWLMKTLPVWFDRATNTFAEQQRYEREQCAQQFNVLADSLTKQNEAIAKLAATSDQAFMLLKDHHNQSVSAMMEIYKLSRNDSPRSSERTRHGLKE